MRALDERRHEIRRLATVTGVALATAVAIGSVAPSQASRERAGDPVGRWYAEGGAAQVDLRDCGGELCGQVVWLRSPFDDNGCELRDRFNPDESLRNRPVVGIEVLRGLAPTSSANGSWESGTIYDPGSGNTYRASMNMLGENRLELRGYIGIPLIGRTTKWFRVGSEQAICTAAE
jgi:uncharacterized protein (DUF2147 family)